MHSKAEVQYVDLALLRKIALGVLFILLFLIPALSYAAPPINKPGYWVTKLKSPDEVVLSSAEIETLNRATLENIDQMADLEQMPAAIPGERVMEWLWSDSLFSSSTKYGSSGKPLHEDFFDEAAYNMNLDGMLDSADVRFGVIVGRADIRALPTEEAVLARPGRGEFDLIQYTSAYPPEAVAVLHTSRDGQWGYVQTQALRGWIQMDKVALGRREDVFAHGKDFLMVTGSKVAVYSDSSFKNKISEVPMGSSLRLVSEGATRSPWVVSFPEKGPGGELVWIDAYLSPRADVHAGYLPYTRKNIINQAFKMLGEEYGWGGREGMRDCSLFIRDLFATVGLKLPRNSRQQGVTGDIKARFAGTNGSKREVTKALKSSDPGITLLTMKGHVMLLIGELKGKPYVIHQIFGYKDGSRMKYIKKVAVTSLDIGRRSRAGSLKNRLKGVNELIVPGDFHVSAGVDKAV